MSDPITTAADFTRLLEADVQRHLGDAKLTLARYGMLTRAEASTVAELAKQAGVSQQMASKTVHDLDLLGYLQQSPNQRLRPRRLHVSERGRAALHRAAALDLSPTLLAAMEAYVAGATA